MSRLSPFFVHLGMRARAVAGSPSALLTLLVFGVASLVFWPTTWLPAEELGTDPAPHEKGWQLGALWIMWLYMWPMVPTLACRGRANGSSACNPLSTVAVPALPVSPAARALAEATIVLLVAAIVRIAGLTFLLDESPMHAIRTTVSGSFLMLPITLSYALSARSLNIFMLRPLTLTILVTGAASLGLTGSWVGLLAIVGCACWLVMRFAEIEEPDLGRWAHESTASDRSRPALDPLEQLRSDTWSAPLRTWGPWIALTAALLAGALILDLNGLLFDWGFFAAFELYLVVILQAVFRPLGSNLAMEGLVGKHGAKRGDFLRAWSVVPVPRQVVLRRVWLHSMFFGALTWALPVLLLGIRTWISHGELGLRAADGGNLADIILPSAAFIPMLAGFLVAACAGQRIETVVSGITLVLGVHTALILRLVLHNVFGKGSSIADILTLVYLALLFIVASAPPLRFLRMDSKPEPVR